MQCPSCGQENSPDARVCSRCNTPLPVMPLSLPEIGVGASYSYGWKQLWKHFWMLLLIMVILFAISLGLSLLSQGIAALGGGYQPVFTPAAVFDPLPVFLLDAFVNGCQPNFKSKCFMKEDDGDF